MGETDEISVEVDIHLVVVVHAGQVFPAGIQPHLDQPLNRKRRHFTSRRACRLITL